MLGRMRCYFGNQQLPDRVLADGATRVGATNVISSNPIILEEHRQFVSVNKIPTDPRSARRYVSSALYSDLMSRCVESKLSNLPQTCPRSCVLLRRFSDPTFSSFSWKQSPAQTKFRAITDSRELVKRCV